MIQRYIERHPVLRLAAKAIPFRMRAGLLKFASRTHSLPNWEKILRNDLGFWKAAQAAAESDRILIATSVGGFLPGAVVESLLAVALTLRGARVHILLCDHLLPACLQSNIGPFLDQEHLARYGPSKWLCKSCFAPADNMYRSLGLPVHRYSELVTPQETEITRHISASVPLKEITNYRLDGLAVGEHAMAGALRFYARGTLEGEPQAEAILRRFFQAALLTAFATQRLLNQYQFASICFHHGIYIPQGVIGEVARQWGVRVVNWNVAYRKKRFIFSHHDTYHHTLLSEPVANWENLKWTPEMESELLNYLKSRWQGTRDWIWFHEKPQEELAAIARELGVDFSKPSVGLLTNVFWDAQLHYRANAFPNMLEWMLQTIRYFSQRSDLQLIIRIHPAEVRGTIPSRQLLVDEIRRAFPILPPNVFIIPPESRVSTYAVMEACNAAIIYGTKMGVELTSIGMPVIVGGEAWIRNKGLTMDASSVEDYFRLLDQLPLREPLSGGVTQRARKYAYHFFFRRMIPLSFIEPTPGWPPYKIQISGIEDLLPGRDTGLDVICDGILNGTEFIYPAEQLMESRDYGNQAIHKTTTSTWENQHLGEGFRKGRKPEGEVR